MCRIIHQKQSSDKKALSDFYHRPLLLAYSRRHRHRPLLLPMPSIPTSFSRIHEYFLVKQKRIVFSEHKRCIVFFPLLFVVLFLSFLLYSMRVLFVLLIDAVCFYCWPLNMRIISVEQRWRWDYDNDRENTNRWSVWETFCLPLLLLQLLLLLLLTFVRHKIYLGASLFLALRHQWHTMCATRINTL